MAKVIDTNVKILSDKDIKDSKYDQLNKFIEYTRTFALTKKIKKGKLYSFTYDVMANENFMKLPDYVTKWFDTRPIVYIVGINSSKKTITGINFHHLPIYARFFWLNKFLNTVKPTADGKFRILWRNLFVMFKKSSAAVRQYRIDRISYLRNVPVDDWEEIFKYKTETLLGAEYEEIAMRYSKFVPKI